MIDGRPRPAGTRLENRNVMDRHQQKQWIFRRLRGAWIAHAALRMQISVENLDGCRLEFASLILVAVALVAAIAAPPALSAEVVQGAGVHATSSRQGSSNSTRHFSLSSPACRAFQSQILPDAAGAGKFRTDQLVVIRNGETLFDWSDGLVRKDAPRGMWSVSKTLTATLIGTAVQDGKLKLDDPVVRYLPELLRAPGADASRLKKIKIRDLLAMTSGFRWTENEQSPAQDQTILPFLYSEGYRDLVNYVGGRSFAAQPGEVWNYSSANAVLAMAILRNVYGAEANDMPWNNLFRPLDMKSARFEKDRHGNYVGSAYIHLSARDLAKIGELYLHDGVIGGKRLLPEGWVDKVAKVPVAQSLDNVRVNGPFAEAGLYSQGSFWLNRAVPGGERPYPHLPESMMFASGLMGQGLIVLPEQGLIIARTAHDDPLATLPADIVIGNAVRCFAPDASGVSRGAPLALKTDMGKPFNPFSIFEDLSEFEHTLSQGTLQGMMAKELCSCHFITGLSVDECIARSPVPTLAAHAMADIATDDRQKIVSITPRFSDRPTQARVNLKAPREGCRLTYGAADP